MVAWGWDWGEVTKGFKKILWGDRYVQYPDFADSFMGVCACVYIYVCMCVYTYIYTHMCVCQNIKLSTLNICT